jgi:hypothetical protein
MSMALANRQQQAIKVKEALQAVTGYAPRAPVMHHDCVVTAIAGLILALNTGDFDKVTPDYVANTFRRVSDDLQQRTDFEGYICPDETYQKDLV